MLGERDVSGSGLISVRGGFSEGALANSRKANPLHEGIPGCLYTLHGLLGGSSRCPQQASPFHTPCSCRWEEKIATVSKVLLLFAYSSRVQDPSLVCRIRQKLSPAPRGHELHALSRECAPKALQPLCWLHGGYSVVSCCIDAYSRKLDN